MENFLARCSILAIIGGGFAATGDLSAIVSRGRRLIEAVDVPAAAAADAPAADAAMAPDAPAPPAGNAPRAAPLPPTPAAPTAAPSPPLPAPVPPDDGRQAVDHRPPANGPERIDVAGLRAGDRFTVWLRTTTIGTPLRLVCDVIDPTAGEVIVHGGTAGPPARGTILSVTGRPTGQLVRGSEIRVQRIGSGAPELLASGTIAALNRG